MQAEQQRHFAPDVLDLLKTVEEVQLEPRSPHAKHRGPVTIWIVVVDDNVYVRSYRGAQGRWYQALLANPEGVLRVGPREIPFRAVRVDDPRTIAQVSEAYRRKYERSWPNETDDMLREDVLPTTLRLEPLPG
jgi:hypothetical protein